MIPLSLFEYLLLIAHKRALKEQNKYENKFVEANFVHMS